MIDEELKRQIAKNPQLNQIIKSIRQELATKGFDKKKSLAQTLQLLATNELILRDYLLEAKHCSPGPMQNCQQPNIGFEKQISYHNGKFYVDLTHCDHWKLAHRQQLRQNYLIYTDYNLEDLPEDLPQATKLLKSYESQLPVVASQKRYSFLTQSWELINGNSAKGFYLFAPSDYGKTFLFRLLANSWAAQEKSQIALVKVPKLINDCRTLIQKKANEKYQRLLSRLKKVDVLFMDDFGAESISRWSRDDILCEILNYRCDQNKLTFINSNFSWKQLTQHYILAKENPTIEQIKVKRFLSRLKRLTTEWRLTGGKI